MKTRTVEIVRGDTDEKTSAELLLCPECGEELFVIYTPAGMNHVHFQCVACGTSFCDGCTNASPAAVDDGSDK